MNKFEEFDNQKRERFDEVSEKEQIQRFVNLKSLFADKTKKLIRKDEENEEEKEKRKRANYFDFIKNAYKYPDEVKIEGVENPSHHRQFFSQAEAGNKVIKEILNIFLDFKQNNNELEFVPSADSLKMALLDDTSFLERKNGQILLNMEKLKKMFRWCLIAFVKKGEFIGREPGVNEEEIDKLCDDIEDIINQISPEFAKNETFNKLI